MKENAFTYVGPLISVIIPAYNVEKYIGECLDSILEQTYRNIEIVVVNDAATDNTGAIINNYAMQNSCIKVINHEENLGLFQARISGVEAASGKYIAFVDGDDTVSIDWFRTLIRCAEKENADMVIGEFVYNFVAKDGANYKEFHNIDPMRINDFNFIGDEAFTEFLRQECTFFSWHVVWNKLYKKELWEKCMPLYKKYSKEHERIVMWEDAVFSSAAYKNADHVVNTHGAYYLYRQNEESAIKAAYSGKNIEKYLCDVASALEFIESLIENESDKIKELYSVWKKNAVSIVYHNLAEKRKYEDVVRKILKFNGEFTNLDYVCFITNVRTRLDENYNWEEGLKRSIASDDIQFLSFDIFDTLIMRPFIYPTDLFSLLSKDYNEDTGAVVDFARMRISAEEDCRKTLYDSQKEDITLDEIYDFFAKRYSVRPEKISKMKELEISKEIELSSERTFGKKLYELALDLGKKIILVSDMYLTSDVVERILSKNGYKDYYKLYMSSDIKLGKYSGHLFSYVLKDIKTQNSHVLHIGDNWASDYEMPSKIGMKACFVPKAWDKYLGNVNGGNGNLFRNAYGTNGWIEDTSSLFAFSPTIRNLVALQVNKVCDNPFITYDNESDFNIDPRVVGYSALGPHVLAVVKWLIENATRDKVPTIHFVARDGNLIKNAFDVINHTDIKSNYIRVSRKALLLADVDDFEDLYSLCRKVDVYRSSPKKLVSYLNPILKDTVSVEDIKKRMELAGLDYEKNLNNEGAYASCMKVLIGEFLEYDKLKTYKERLRRHFSEFIQKGDYIFDIGYSGRVESALSNLLGFSVGAYYIHTNDDIAYQRQRKYGCRCETFYPMKPRITGVVREQLLMELGPSTVGFYEKDGKLEPIFGEYEEKYIPDMITGVIQKNAMMYVEDYEKTFGHSDPDYYFNYMALCAPIEHFLEFSNEHDRRLFMIHEFEDDANGEASISVYDFWNRETENHRLWDKMKRDEFARAELDRIYGSYTYKIGSIIMWLPKKFRRIRERLTGVKK